MHIAELPMIVFTVLGQMSVGAFVVLGVIQVAAARRHDSATVDRITDPALYAIGPTLVLGMVASMFHMNDVGNTLNVIRHIETSWLSREIVSGVAFAGLGFAFAAMQWFKWGTARLRQALALVTAVVGLALVWSMSMVYYSLAAVPAWNTWATPVQFFTTTVLLGSLAVGAAFMVTLWWRNISAARKDVSYEIDEATRTVLTTAVRGLAVTAIVALGAEFVVTPLHIAGLTAAGGVAAASAEVYTGGWFVVRLLLVFAGAGLLAALVARYARRTTLNATLGVLATSAFGLALVGELIGRSQFYEQMTRIGM